MMVACFLTFVPNLVHMPRVIAENEPHFSRHSTDDFMQINFRFHYWSRGHRASPRGRVASLYKFFCKYLYSVWMLATYEIQYGRRLPSWICCRKSWDDARRPIDGGYGRENFVMIGVVLFMLQVFEFFVVHT